MVKENLDNNVYIGNRNISAYIFSAMAVLNKNMPCVLKARGRKINRAVYVAEMIRNKFMKGTIVEKIEIGTDVMKNDGKETNVSTIEITMKYN